VILLSETGSTTADGLVEQKELLPGVYLAGSLVNVVNRCVITSELSTTEKEGNMSEPVVIVTEVDAGGPIDTGSKEPCRV
jgi:hypothetical protein